MWAGPRGWGRGLHSTPQAGFSQSCRARGPYLTVPAPPPTHTPRTPHHAQAAAALPKAVEGVRWERRC